MSCRSMPGVEHEDHPVLEQQLLDLADRLHDGPVQALIGAQCQLVALMQADEVMRASLEPLAAHIETALRELRDILHVDVRPGPVHAARATRVRMVSGWYEEDSAFLGVEDNGVGFDTTNRFYLHRLKGFTVIESKDGVSVRIVLPASLLLG